MSEAKPKIGVEQELKQLERRLDELLGAIAQLHEENRALRQRQDSMMAERATLLDSDEYLNVKMREIRDAGNIVGLDRIAVMAALNLAHELLKLRGHHR